MFGRSTPVTTTRASGIPSDSRMSRWPCRPAVAVNARTGGLASALADRTQPAVVRPNILSQAIDAVCFVDDEVSRPSAGDLVHFCRANHFRIEALRGAIQELDDPSP